jgi:hypothetical protein
MKIRSHIRLISVLLAGLAGAGLLTVGFGLTPLSGSIFGQYLGLGPKGDFSLSSNSPITITQGGTGTISVTVTSINHLSGDVGVTATLTTSSITPPVVSTSQSSVKLTPGGTVSFSVNIATTSSTSLGYYNISLQGKTGTVSHSINLSVDVTQPPSPDFSLSASPSSLLVAIGSNSTGTLTVSSVQGYSGNIALSAVVSPVTTDHPSVSIKLTSLKLLGGATNSTTIIVHPTNYTVGYYNIIITGVSGSLSHPVTIPLTVYGGSGEAISYQSYSIDSGTQATLTVQNLGGANMRFVSYYVVDGNLNQYNLASWNGPFLSPAQTGALAILIGASCTGCVLSGSSFNFVTGYSYGITLVTATGSQYTWVIGQSASQEHLSFEGNSFSSGTNVTVNLRNTGAISIQLSGYSARDASGNAYSLSSFAGPTLAPNQAVAVSLTIGSSCPSCRLLGSPFTFNFGYGYWIVVTTSRGSIFLFQVFR